MLGWTVSMAAMLGCGGLVTLADAPDGATGQRTPARSIAGVAPDDRLDQGLSRDANLLTPPDNEADGGAPEDRSTNETPPPASGETEPPQREPAANRALSPEEYYERMTASERQRLFEFVRHRLPELAEELDRSNMLQPDRPLRKRIVRLIPRVLEIMDRLEQSPAIGELMLEEFRADAALRVQLRRLPFVEGDAARSAEIQTRIRDLVAKRFDVRLRRQEAEIADLETRLDNQKRRLQRQRLEREQIIDRLYRQMVEDRPPAVPNRRLADPPRRQEK